MFGCRRYRRQLPLWVGGDLDDRLALRIRLHVKNCTGCASAADALRRARRPLEQSAVQPLPVEHASLWPELRPLCRTERPQHSDLRGWIPTLSLAAACACLVVGVMLLPGVPSATAVQARSRSLGPAKMLFGPVSVDQPARAEGSVLADFERRLLLPDVKPYSERKRGRF